MHATGHANTPTARRCRSDLERLQTALAGYASLDARIPGDDELAGGLPVLTVWDAHSSKAAHSVWARGDGYWWLGGGKIAALTDPRAAAGTIADTIRAEIRAEIQA